MTTQVKYHKKGHQLKLEILAYISRIQKDDATAESELQEKMQKYKDYEKAVKSALIGLESKQSKNEKYARIKTSTLNKSGAWPYLK